AQSEFRAVAGQRAQAQSNRIPRGSIAMSRGVNILRNVGIGLAAFVVLVLLAGILTVRTEWFRNYVREKIITATADGTGGRVEIGSFAFDWTRLSAVVTNFVIHGNEPAGASPYLSASRVEVHARLLT